MDLPGRPVSFLSFTIVASFFVATGGMAAGRSEAQDLRELLEEAVERQELCAAAASRPVPPPYCSEASWGEQCADLRRELGWLAARTRPLVVPDETGARSQAHFDNSDLLLTQFAAALAAEMLCADGDESPPDAIDVLWDDRDTLAAAVGAYAAGLELAEAQARSALAELNHLVKLFRQFKTLVERAEVEREDDQAPDLRFGATRSADGDDFMRMLCNAVAEESRAAIDAVAAFSTAFDAHPLARLPIAQMRAVLFNALSMGAWGREEMLDCDLTVEAPAWLTGDRAMRAGEQLPVPVAPEIARVDSARHPFDRRFVTETVEALDALRECTEVEEEEDEAEVAGEIRASCAALESAATRLRAEVFEPIADLAEAGQAEGYRFARAELARIELLGPLARANAALEELCERDRNAERWRREFLDATVSLVGDLDPGLGHAGPVAAQRELRIACGVHAGVNPAIPGDRLPNQEETP